jgi:hypothetical protein
MASDQSALITECGHVASPSLCPIAEYERRRTVSAASVSKHRLSGSAHAGSLDGPFHRGSQLCADPAWRLRTIGWPLSQVRSHLRSGTMVLVMTG